MTLRSMVRVQRPSLSLLTTDLKVLLTTILAYLEIYINDNVVDEVDLQLNDVGSNAASMSSSMEDEEQSLCSDDDVMNECEL
ncbi:hypothetical protein A2U01_0002771 [Trifolium medium]|uniref:Uncharacterized protein n=1 Tax=Trifolium medium TaxID=97028 RepID=A0A392M3T9_9FABA|nr:hypothetical protein [Trifolium medium]